MALNYFIISSPLIKLKSLELTLYIREFRVAHSGHIKMVGNTLYLYGTDLRDRLQTKRFIYQNILVVNYPKKGKIPQYALDEWNKVKREFLGKFRQR